MKAFADEHGLQLVETRSYELPRQMGGRRLLVLSRNRL
jgi:hypothetical protein